MDANKLFENGIANDDKYDPNLRVQSNRGYDLNNISKSSEKDLDRKLREDLESEQVNYKFD
jgi:hypothetical protein